MIAYDPAPALRATRLPVLALFGELDDNVLAAKNRVAWEAALAAGGHPDYSLRIVPKANHAMLEAKVGTTAEMKSLQRFVPEYHRVVLDWLSTRVDGFGVAPRDLSRRRSAAVLPAGGTPGH
jgi:dienelactone hydrolase